MRKRYSSLIGAVLAVLGALAALVNTESVLDAAVGAVLLLGIGWTIGIPLDRRRARHAIDVSQPAGAINLVDTASTRAGSPLKAFIGGGLRVGLAVAVVIGLVGIGASAVLYSKVQSLTDDLADVSSRAGDLEDRARALENQSGDLQSQLDSASRTLDGVDVELGRINRELDSQPASSVTFADLTLVAEAIVKLRRCVNDYMDTVGQAGGGYYRYYYC